MRHAPAVIVHGLGMALEAVGERLPVTLLSAPGAGVYAGVGWWQALTAAARLAAPDCDVQDILDCGNAAGRALEALRAGQRALVLQAPAAIFSDLAARAAGQGSVLLDVPPPALDLAEQGAARRLAAWLANPSG